MIKSKLVKTLALGLCMSALYTGVAFAGTGGQSVPPSVGIAVAGSTEASAALFDKQSEVDQYLFKDHAAEVAAQGFTVVYTGVADQYVEIGITPFSDANANFLYDIFGKDSVKVVESEAANTVSTATAPDASVSSDVAQTDAASTAVVDKSNMPTRSDSAEPADNEKVYKGAQGDQDVKIQIEATDANAAQDDGTVYETLSAESAPTTDTATDEMYALASQSGMAVDNNAAKESISTPIIVLLIAGGAVIIGGAAVVVTRKKVMK